MKKTNYKKDYSKLYSAAVKPKQVEVQAFKRIHIKGIGSSKDEAYIRSVDALYTISYYIKNNFAESPIVKYKHFVVAPLEVFWKEDGSFEAFINQPKFVTEEVFEIAKKAVLEDKERVNELHKDLFFDIQEEGKALQSIHAGSLDTKEKTIKIIKDFANESSLEIKEDSLHEIYLGDLRKLRPENHKTIIRIGIK